LDTQPPPLVHAVHGSNEDWLELPTAAVLSDKMRYPAEFGVIAIVPVPSRLRIDFGETHISMQLLYRGEQSYFACMCGQISSPLVWGTIGTCANPDKNLDLLTFTDDLSSSIDCVHVLFSKEQVDEMQGHACGF
jgi:hypothetical protein